MTHPLKQVQLGFSDTNMFLRFEGIVLRLYVILIFKERLEPTRFIYFSGQQSRRLEVLSVNFDL